MYINIADSQYLSPPEGVQAKNHVRQKSEAEIMLEEYEAHKRIQREWERNYYESKQRLEQSKSMEYGFKELDDGLPTPHFGVHRSKSSIDFRHPLNNNLDHRQRLGGAYPALTEHPHRPAERLEALPRLIFLILFQLISSWDYVNHWPTSITFTAGLQK